MIQSLLTILNIYALVFIIISFVAQTVIVIKAVVEVKRENKLKNKEPID